MRRYMICPIIGDGTPGPPGVGNPFRALVSDVDGVNVAALIPTDENGQPIYDFAFCLVSALNWTPVQQLTNSYLFPDFALDSQMSGMESEARTGLEQSVEAYDLDGQGLHIDAGHNSTDSYRHLLDVIGKQFEPVFSINNFNVAEAAITPE